MKKANGIGNVVPEYEEITREVAKLDIAKKSDIVLYNGPIEYPFDYHFKSMCRAQNSSENVVLVLVTFGGDANSAYRMGRGLQQYYDKVDICIPSWCKSAGTLLCVSAQAMYIGDFGELGPVDVQRAKRDELIHYSSGLTENAAIDTIENTAMDTFHKFVISLIESSGGRVTTKTASDIAATLAGKLIEPLMAQIDPVRIGENSRAIKIAYDYGTRLNAKYGNLIKGDENMDFLISSYSSHEFVIDRDEAKLLFNNVESITGDLEVICNGLGQLAIQPANEKPVMMYLTGKRDDHESNTQKAKKNARGKTQDTKRNDVGDTDGTKEEAPASTNS